MSSQTAGQILIRDIVRVAQVGAVTGSVAGFAGLIAANGSGAIAGATAASWTWLLVATLPLGLALVTALEVWRAGGTAYSATSALALVRVLLVIGLLGGVGGAILEFVVASYIPALFSFWKLDGAAVRTALVAHYPWIAVLGALGAAAAMAVFEGGIFRFLRASRD